MLVIIQPTQFNAGNLVLMKDMFLSSPHRVLGLSTEYLGLWWDRLVLANRLGNISAPEVFHEAFTMLDETDPTVFASQRGAYFDYLKAIGQGV